MFLFQSADLERHLPTHSKAETPAGKGMMTVILNKHWKAPFARKTDAVFCLGCSAQIHETEFATSESKSKFITCWCVNFQNNSSTESHQFA